MLENNFTKRDFPVLHIKPVDQMESMTNSVFSCSALNLFRTSEKEADFLFSNIWDTEHISSCSCHHPDRLWLLLSTWGILSLMQSEQDELMVPQEQQFMIPSFFVGNKLPLPLYSYPLGSGFVSACVFLAESWALSTLS